MQHHCVDTKKAAFKSININFLIHIALRYIVFSISVYLVIFITQKSWAATDKPKLLIIESYHESFPWDQGYTKAIRQSLGDSFEYHFFRMDTKRIPKSQYEKKASIAIQLYKELQPQIVVLGDDNALKLVGTQLIPLNAKMVYLGINNNPRFYGITTYTKITGVLERPLLKRSLLEMKAFLPINSALAMFDDSITSSIIRTELLGSKAYLKAGDARLTYQQYTTFAQWQQAVLESPKSGHDAIFVGLYQHLLDEDKTFVPAQKVIEWTSQNSPVPIFGFWDFSIGDNMAAGGYVLKGEDQGRVASELIQLLYQQSDDKSIAPRHILSGHYVISKQGAKRWGLTPPKQLLEKIMWVD
jgi:hypothetical protein